MALMKHDPQYLHAIVDMGSNGIRFSITSLQPPTARIMPTLYQHRTGISLYDAQYSASGERQPIDDTTIGAVLVAFRQFKRTCSDFRVPDSNITVLATEATRTAINSEDFRRQIKDAVGWEVELMPKEVEGEVGALGIASSLPEVKGLVMDLGGGSTQLSWLISSQGDLRAVQMPPNGAMSLPYGAAAMTRRLAEAEKNGTLAVLRSEMQSAFRDAFARIQVPEELISNASSRSGYTLYLSGGGFRGWGYVLMSQHPVQPYPIPVINGFKAHRRNFVGTETVKAAALETLENEDENIFRVSDRRASQVPAVAFLINTLKDALPEITNVRFCQGGVREGYLFKSLSPETQALHPLVIATEPYAIAPAAPTVALLQSAFPDGSTSNAADDYKATFTTPYLESFANLMYYHSTHSKDLQASAALRSTTSGVLAAVHGVLHESRTLLALLLCARWGGDVPPTDQSFKSSLEQLVESPWTLWWINYIGAVAGLICAVYPAGASNGGGASQLSLEADWGRDEKARLELVLTATFETKADVQMFAKEVKSIEQTGKRKNWIHGRDGVGYRVAVEVKSAAG